ncbi:RRP12-like protein [Venturia canescens]|uniref:RRP12-like protein n=1 Tax=Venturia canescens TaxID=32260 RepID=UPI001C9BC56C|nr:RRP12-like protein [Venturia canescens]XP_043269035.1 RRP12-like protein [Venturia canescens]
MGKLGPRLNSRKKAKRWVKGQSSSSNPETKKHRDQARSRFFQENIGSKGLTTQALRQHDAIQGTAPEKIEVDDEQGTVGASTFKTFDTFASDYSNCSNMSFSRFLNHFQSTSIIHKEMLAILAAVTDVIKQNGGTESTTEYYAALMTTLKTAETEESVAAILSLLGMGLKTIPKNVLKLQFSEASKTFFQVLTKYAASENFLILRHSIGCLSFLLRAQEAAVWSNASTQHVLDGILTFTVHAKPKVRKAAQHAVCAILKGSDIMRADDAPAYHPAATQIAKHCLAQLENSGQPGSLTTTLHVLTLLKDIAHQLPKTHVKSVCEALLRIMTLNNVLVTSCCLQTLHSLFVSRPLEAVLPSQLNAQIINALYDYQPAPGDTQPTLAWLAVMQEAHCNLVAYDVHLCAANIPRMIEKSTELWLSDKSEVLTAASHTMKTLLQVCVAPLCATRELAKKYKTTLSKIFQLVQSGMKYRYNGAWHHVLHLQAVLFQVAGKTCRDELSMTLVELADLRDSHKFTYNAEVEYAVGAAVKSMGPEVVLRKIPLQGNEEIIDLKRSWLLPVLKDCTSQASIGYFLEFLFPMAAKCEKKSAELKTKNDGIGAHSYELLYSQIWALLPSFCNNASDVQDNFKNIAKILGVAISSKKDLRISVMAALRKLITRSTEAGKTTDTEELARFAKNYLPLLFNLYTTKPNGSDEEGQRLAAFDTIKVYLPITSKELIGELFDRALARLDETDNDDFTRQSIFDLIRVLTQYTDTERIQALYDKSAPILMDNKHQKEQKKAYRFLEEICANQSQICRDFVIENRRAIQKLLTNSASMAIPSSKAARLRCINHLIETHPQIEKTKFLRSIVPEVILCIKEINEKCRNYAYQLLNTLADKLLKNPEDFGEYIEMLVAGLGGSPSYCSATLLALASLTYRYNGAIGVATVHQVLQHACSLLTGPTREIALSALSFIKVYLSAFPTTVIGPNLPQIVQALCGMTDDCKRHFRQKVRDILVKLVRKYSTEVIAGLIPASDETMHKRLKNIRKIETRKQKSKEERGSKNEESSDEEFSVKRRPKSVEEILADSDEEFEDTEQTQDSGKKHKKSNKKQTWIQEAGDNIVDLVDPTAARNITATKPGQGTAKKQQAKAKDFGFKTAGDGRLIIKDESDDDDSDGDTKKKKKKLPFLGSDSDDDMNDEDDAKSTVSAKPGQRKRKLSGSTDAASTKAPSKYRAGGTGIHRPVKAPKTNEDFGADYRSRKAKGDVKKKGKPDPFAYVPLTRAALNKRKKMKSAGRFKNIISGAKKGARIGSKGKRKLY